MSTKKKVLVVDDDADFIEMHKAMLETNGYDVVTACNGRECLEKARAEKPDLIILDVMMATDSDGFDVSRELRGDREATKDVPIIMVTSVHARYPFNFKPDETWLPVQKFLEKPVHPDRLLQEVREQLDELPRTEGASAKARGSDRRTT
ncbi:MAG TPA: response regulator [Thermoguttaceae bacterium]|nr:response regulator [Thermoguttaceae bacterium]